MPSVNAVTAMFAKTATAEAASYQVWKAFLAQQVHFPPQEPGPANYGPIAPVWVKSK